MNNFDKTQKKLVEFCERVHFVGIRHKGLSGSLCEDALILSLKKYISELQFFKGHILSKVNTYGPQTDIIITSRTFKSTNLFLKNVTKIIDIVPENYVKGIIEVKKWTSPKMIKTEGPVNKNIYQHQQLFPNIPFFFITFRFEDRLKATYNNWDSINNQLHTNYKYCFFSRSSHNRKENRFNYPWEEQCWTNFSKNCKYSGQYERLVSDIKSLINPS